MMQVRKGFTLIELIVVVALTAAVMALAAPFMREMVQVQRLRGVNAQLVTDLQFARSEAVARNVPVRVIANSNSTLSCYALIVTDDASLCDCRRTPGAICTGAAIEVRTVQVDKTLGIDIGTLKPDGTSLVFYPVNGSTAPYKGETRSNPPVISLSIDSGSGDTQRRLTTTVSVAGRPTVCYDRSYAAVSGIARCPGGN